MLPRMTDTMEHAPDERRGFLVQERFLGQRLVRIL